MTYISVKNTLVNADLIVSQESIKDEMVLETRKKGTGARKHHVFVKKQYYPIIEANYPNLFNNNHQPLNGVDEEVNNYFKISSLLNDIDLVNKAIGTGKEEPLDPAKLLHQFKTLASKQGLTTEFYLVSKIGYAKNGLAFKGWKSDVISYGEEILKFFFHKTQLKIYIFKEGGSSAFYWEIDQSNINTVDGMSTVMQQQKGDRDHSTPLQTIYFGAPGTGKSHTVSEILRGKEATTERVTFHPDFDYSSFVGGFKPKQDEDGNIGYGFVPQIFINMYVKAWKDLSRDYYLVIEEINRGNCAEIFGDVFQLLDRDPQYKVTPSNELMIYLSELLDVDHDGLAGGLTLPPNLHILATMNTSDQSLYPMDSAFKRRWDWVYVPISYEKDEQNKSSEYLIIIGDFAVNWIDFIHAINVDNIMDNPNLGMDKCIGNYFIKPKTGNEISLEDFIHKVIFYLWNDVFKGEDNNVFGDRISYESFFPIETNGYEQVKSLMARLNLPLVSGE